MTCIVGIAWNNKVVLGADSAGMDAWYRTMPRRDKKLFRSGSDDPNETMLIGYTSSFRMGQILEHHVSSPRHYADVDVHTYLVREWIPAARRALKDQGFTEIDNNRESGGQFLIGYRRRLFAVYDDFQVAEPQEPFWAVGCGADYALGAIHALIHAERVGGLTGQHSLVHPAEYYIEAGLHAARQFSAPIRDPWIIEKLEYEDAKK